MDKRIETPIYVHMVKRALDRAFAAAEEVQARHDGFHVEVTLTSDNDQDLVAAGSFGRPAVIRFDVSDEHVDLGWFKVGLFVTRSTMVARLDRLIGDVVTEMVESNGIGGAKPCA